MTSDPRLSAFLADTDWSTGTLHPLAGDASARRYLRVIHPDGATAIVMDAPPASCGSQANFVRIARLLTDHDLAAPDILKWDDPAGLLLLSDLGQTDMARHLMAYPAETETLYTAATDILRHLGTVRPPPDLPRMTPDIGTAMTDIAFDWAATDDGADLRAQIQSHLHTLLTDFCPDPQTLSLRDYHAENLIWRPARTGLHRMGLLDFQDAFVTDPTYDLASLMRDARRDVDDAALPDLLHRLDPQADPERQRQTFHLMAVQRNLRILGIFERLARQQGKTRYLAFLPRVKAHLARDLAAPALTSLRATVTRAFLTEATP